MAIGKINYGCGAKGLLNYLERGKKHEFTLDRVDEWQTLNMVGENKNEWLQELHFQRELSERVEKPFGHVSISFDPEKEGLDITNKQMFEYSENYLNKMELKEHQAVMAIHRDTEHPHVHIVFNRVGDDGLAWSTSNDYYRSKDAVREVSTEMGYDIVMKHEGLHIERSDVERLTRGEDCWKLELKSRIDDALKFCDGSRENFQQKLMDRDVEMRINTNGRGLSYKLTDMQDKEGREIIMKASKVGKEYKLSSIDEKLQLRENYTRSLTEDLGRAFKEGQDLSLKQELDGFLKENLGRNYGREYTGESQRIDAGEIRGHEDPSGERRNIGRSLKDSYSLSEGIGRTRGELEPDSRRLEENLERDALRLKNNEERKHEIHFPDSGIILGDREFSEKEQRTRENDREVRKESLSMGKEHLHNSGSNDIHRELNDIVLQSRIRSNICRLGRSEGAEIKRDNSTLTIEKRFEKFEGLAKEATVRECLKFAPKEVKELFQKTNLLKMGLEKEGNALKNHLFKSMVNEIGHHSGVGKELDLGINLWESKSLKETAEHTMKYALDTVPGGKILKASYSLAKELTLSRGRDRDNDMDIGRGLGFFM